MQRWCLPDAGNCKAVLGQANSASSQVKAVDLTLPEGTQPRANSETSSAKALGHRVRAMQSVPTATPFANAGLPAMKQPESFLGRGQLGERPSALPSMTMHQLGDQAQFVVRPLLDWALLFASAIVMPCMISALVTKSA